MNKKAKLGFSSFLDFFPSIELPVVLTEEGVTNFSKTNTPLSSQAIEEYILSWEKEADELTEFIPCFRLPDSDKYDAIVYWKAGLMKYEYILITLTKEHQVICRRVISSTLADGSSIKRSISKIDEDLIIHIMAGENLKDEQQYDSANSRAFSMEIQANGEVVFCLHD